MSEHNKQEIFTKLIITVIVFSIATLVMLISKNGQIDIIVDNILKYIQVLSTKRNMIFIISVTTTITLSIFFKLKGNAIVTLFERMLGTDFEFHNKKIKKTAYNKKTTYIVELLLQKKGRDTFTVIMCLFALLFCIVFFGVSSHYLLMKYSIITTITLSLANFGLLLVRIKLGYYGSTSSEVREILNFIAENSDNGTFGDGGNAKIKIFYDTEEDSDRAFDGVPANTGGGQ